MKRPRTCYQIYQREKVGGLRRWYYCDERLNKVWSESFFGLGGDRGKPVPTLGNSILQNSRKHASEKTIQYVSQVLAEITTLITFHSKLLF